MVLSFSVIEKTTFNRQHEIENHDFKLTTIAGDWTEGSTVTVELNGKQYSRRVKWIGKFKDLTIVINNTYYFYSDTWNY